MAALVQYLGTGRRKTAVARVFLRPGKGEITVNGRPSNEYFPTETARAMVRQPLLATETADKFDVLILADGGGVAGQAGAAVWALPARSGGVQRGTARHAEEARVPDPRSRAARAQEVRPEGRPQAVPVLQALSPCDTSGWPVFPAVRGFAIVEPDTCPAQPARANLALDRARGSSVTI